MTLRERIADWISGGLLTLTYTKAKGWMEAAMSEQHVSRQLQHRLDRIAAEETPDSRAEVKRMAAIARGGA